MTGMPPDWTMPVLVGRRVQLEPMRADHVDGLVRAAAEDRRTYGFTDVPSTPDTMARYVAALVAERDRGLAIPFVLRERGADPGDPDRIVGATRFLGLDFWRPTADPAGHCDAASHSTTFHWSTASDAATTFHSTTTTTATTATTAVVTTTGTGKTTVATSSARTPTTDTSNADTSNADTSNADTSNAEAPAASDPAGILPSVAEIGGTWLAASAQRTAVNTEAKLLLLGHAFDAWATLRVCLKTDARNARSRAAIERLGARFEGVRRAHVLAFDGTARDSAYYSIVRAEWPGVRAGLIARLTRP
nr:GNAT family protein [Frankia sp. QA3]